MIKIIMIFFAGVIEQLLYTKYLIAVNNRQAMLSTVLMSIYMLSYLLIVSYAIKDNNTMSLLITYALACGLGNWIILKRENHKKI